MLTIITKEDFKKELIDWLKKNNLKLMPTDDFEDRNSGKQELVASGVNLDLHGMYVGYALRLKEH